VINFDKTNRQLLTSACLSCNEPHFSRPIEELPHVGCCSYSPVFSLFELSKVATEDPSFYFELVNQDANTVNDYTIRINAWIHPAYQKNDHSLKRSTIEQEDLKISYSICRFFKENQGCTLKPSFKNAVCRSFICSTVEDRLATDEKSHLLEWVQDIQSEATSFHRKHETILKERRMSLKEHPNQVFSYLKALTN
jgi:hypothetical protein